MSKRKTNTKFMQEMMDFAPSPLVQAFVLEALAQYSQAIMEDQSDWTEGGKVVPFISQEAWRECAEYVTQSIEKYHQS